ncbi:MAG: transcription-repair coupling factor [Anaerolineae bacterium]|nr:MAG: transcription-repair coupling factor [Anaerolineae bacterium]
MTAANPLLSLLTTLADLQPLRRICRALEDGQPPSNLALPRAARLPVLAALYRALKRPILYLTARTEQALSQMDELALWLPEEARLLFPEPTPLFYENAPWGENVRLERLRVLTVLAAAQIPGNKPDIPPPVIVAPTRAVMTKTLPRREFIKACRRLRPGAQTSIPALARQWVRLGYQPVNSVTAPGEFARLGGILDIWPPAAPKPARIEFFGDEVDTLRAFDPATQRTIRRLDSLLITPAREFILPADPDPENPLSEFHIPVLYPYAGRVFDYLPPDALVVIDDEHAFRETLNTLEEQALALRQDYLAEDLIPRDFPVPYLSADQIADSLPPGRTLHLGPVSAAAGKAAPLAERFTPNPRFGGRLKPLMELLITASRKNHPTVVVSRQANRLAELWHSDYKPLSGGTAPDFQTGSLAEGWLLRDDQGGLHRLLTDGEIFGWQPPRPRRRAEAPVTTPEAAYGDLKTGDWVVHVDHGVGRFVGLVRRKLEGIEREYLCVEYAAGDRLFVPVQQADRLTRYIGPDGNPPTPTRLGSGQWPLVRQRVKQAVQEMAFELLELYARRQVARGHAFSPDTPWQRELEASFPYEETEDQLRALAEVKADMESPRPMDRLVCGDVGFGKTEIALRAAFKAVMDGKQVAMLVPTTILAQQHYHTFRQRLAAFPVEVEMLSRFRTPAEQQNILFRLAKGGIDIVIGTHRLISGDVRFKDLGLVIIDEEQRFGVTHKERLKQLRTEVDVLTLTATPIPRTLYLALTGLRDISTLETPPEERLPVITHVGPYSPSLIRRAILRELERGGQVFFVHNRVQTIEAMRARLERLVPEARFAIAHGQMPEKELAAVMQQFTAGEIDVLVTTSIIESGLDIPNANTLIVDRADTFGLAQLYQLRGRVGRGAQRAYAYFFKHKRKSATLEGDQRLETIAENVHLGAGLSIAMRDMEMRGAGDILGTRQHGHIAAVGFHLYTRLLAEAVKQLRAQRGLPPVDNQLLTQAMPSPVHIDLPLDTTIPESYIPSLQMRLKLYRRIAEAQTQEDIEALRSEFTDRFGPLPPAVENLLALARLKILATAAGLESIGVEHHQIVLRYPEGVHPPRDFAFPDVRVGKEALWMNNGQQVEKSLGRIFRLLEALTLSPAAPSH